MTVWIEEECGIGFGTYVDRSLKKPFEVEHIWANKYERHLDEFHNPHDFSDHRDRFGDLLLLPKDFNASYGAKTYLEKLPHYFGQNPLAASLSPLAYEKNPSFLKFIAETGLPFKPYPDGFTKGDIEERQDLYRRLCEQVWSPEALGLDGGTPSEGTTRQARQTFYGVSLAELIDAGLLSPDEEVVGTRSGHEYRATILPDGRIRADGGAEFDTLSGAADTLTGKSNNGWEFWWVSRPAGLRELARIREEYLSSKDLGDPA